MAWASLYDFNDKIEITFFPSVWEKCKSLIVNDGVYALKGKVDPPNERNEHPSFLVEEVLDINNLKETSVREIHIQLENKIETARDVEPIKNILFDSTGAASIYFHIDTDAGSYIVQANQQMKAPASDEFLNKLRDLPLVSEVWTA